MLILLLFNFLFLPMIAGAAITNTTSNIQSEKKTSSKSSNDVSNSAVVVPIITEGGSMVPTTPPTLLKRNLTNLLDLDKEINKEKSDQSSGSKVAARKGVVFPANLTISTAIETPSLNATTASKTNSSHKADLPVDKDLHVKNDVSQPIAKQNKTTISEPHKNSVTKIVQHKKPLLLSNEALDHMDIVTTESTKSFRIKPVETRHPGVVMPVVITILVVPMFAVLGFMALRRGREVWKNRHYKRMDFLLDGMYNE